MAFQLRNWFRRKPAERKFIGAQLSRLTTGWVTQPLSLDEELRTQYSLLLARARDQANNNPWVKGYVRMVQDNVVGRGFGFRARSVNRNGAPDAPANAALEAAYKDYGRLGLPEMSGQMTMMDVDRLFIRNWAVDGEVIALKHRPNDNPYRYSVQFVDPRRLDIALNKDLGNGRIIRMGVEVDRFHKPLRYYFLPLRPDGSVIREGVAHDIVPADMVYHKFIREDVRQTRGVPTLAVSLLRLNMLEGYEEAELVAARAAAAKMGFLEYDEGTGAYVGDATDDQGNVLTDAEAGAIERLPRGMKFKAWDPSHPNDAFGDFVKMQLRAIATGLGVSYNKLANDLEGVNYSSLREGNLFERETWKTLQEWMVQQWKMPHYDEWLEHALLAGRITINGTPLSPTRLDKYRMVEFTGRRWQWVDPLKEQQANELAINQKLRSRSEIIREMGRDPEEVWKEILAEDEIMEALGIAPVTTPTNTEPMDGNEAN